MTVRGMVMRLVGRRGDCIGFLEDCERRGRRRNRRAQKFSARKLHGRHPQFRARRIISS
jgi:hypothetical protein